MTGAPDAALLPLAQPHKTPSTPHKRTGPKQEIDYYDQDTGNKR